MHWFDVNVFDISLTDMMSIYCVFGFVAIVDDDDDVCVCDVTFAFKYFYTNNKQLLTQFLFSYSVVVGELFLLWFNQNITSTFPLSRSFYFQANGLQKNSYKQPNTSTH